VVNQIRYFTARECVEVLSLHELFCSSESGYKCVLSIKYRSYLHCNTFGLVCARCVDSEQFIIIIVVVVVVVLAAIIEPLNCQEISI
jgi:hypothetical protein